MFHCNAIRRFICGKLYSYVSLKHSEALGSSEDSFALFTFSLFFDFFTLS
jgi:hypothetical protein